MRLADLTTSSKPEPAAAPRNAGRRQPALGASGRGVECAVLFLDVVRYSEQPFAEQVEIKQRINAAVLDATRHLKSGERILMDTGDGVAISFQTTPEDALFVALSLRQALGAPLTGQPVAIRTGINFGVVSVLRDLNGQPSVIGDGINMAQRVMSFANPGQLLISRAFYQILVGQSEDYAAMFTYCGSRTDKHVREHELFEFATPLEGMGQVALPPVMLAARPLKLSAAAPPSSDARDVRPSGHRAFWLAGGGLAVGLTILAAAMGWRVAPPAQPEAPTAVLAAPAAPAAVEVAAAQPTKPTKAVRRRGAPSRQAAAPAPLPEQSNPAALTPLTEPSPQERPLPSATLAFAVSPWGEVLVDGQSYGAAPPLTHLTLPPGEHQVEIRNGVSNAYRTLVRIEPDQLLRIHHKFEDPRPPE